MAKKTPKRAKRTPRAKRAKREPRGTSRRERHPKSAHGARDLEDFQFSVKRDGTPFREQRVCHDSRGKFGPGNCANPRGRGTGKIDLLRILADELAKEIKSGNVGESMAERRTMAHEIAEHYVKLCLGAAKHSEQLRAIEGVLDRMCGKPKQTVEASVARGSVWDDMTEAELDEELARHGHAREDGDK